MSVLTRRIDFPLRLAAACLIVVMLGSSALPVFAQTTGTITGTVTDKNGDPIPDCTVRIGPYLGSPGTWVDLLTDSLTGEYSASVEAGGHMVVAYCEGYAYEYYDDVQEASQAEQVIVEIGQTVTVDLQLDDGGIVTGIVWEDLNYDRVIDPGEPRLENVVVLSSIGGVCTDSNGEYKLVGIPFDDGLPDPGTGVTVPHWTNPWTGCGGPLPYTAAGFVARGIPTEAEPNAVVDIDLHTGGTFSGMVTDATTYQPIAGAEVQFFVAGREEHPNGYAHVPGLDYFMWPGATVGQYQSLGMFDGDYYVKVIADGYLFEYYDANGGTQNIDDAETLSIDSAADNHTGIDFALLPLSVETPAGTDVVVEPINGADGGTPVTMTFGEITGAGTTSLFSDIEYAPPPFNFAIVGDPPLVYDLTTTATFSGLVEVCITYDETAVVSEDNLVLMHEEANVWVDVTTFLDKDANTICGEVTSLSPFAVMEALEQTVSIDVRPGSSRNIIVSNGHGVYPVAILSESGFDATQVDPATVLLDGQGVREVGRGYLLAFEIDVNDDDLDDLVVLIEDGGVYTADDTVATLTGQTYDGLLIRGTDSIVVIVPRRH